MATSGITVSIQAKIEGWQSELKRIQDAAKKVDMGSQLGKDLQRYISILEKQIDSMSKNITQRFTSDTSIDRFNDKISDMEQHFKDIGDIFSSISFSELNTEYISKEIQDLTTQVTTLKTELNASMNEGFQGALTGATQLEKALARVNIDPKNLNFEEIKTALETIVSNSTNEIKKLNEEFTNLRHNLSEFEKQKSEYENMQLLKETDLGKVANSIISKNASDYGFGQIINDEAINRVRIKIEKQIEKIKLSDEKKNQIKQYLNDLVPTSSVKTVRDRIAQIQQILSGKTGLADFELSRNDFSNYLNEIIVQLSDTSALNAALENIRNSFKNLGIREEDIADFIEPLRKALQNQDFNSAINITQTNLTRLQTAYQDNADKIVQIVEEMNQRIKLNQSNFGKTNWTKTFAEKGLAEYEAIIKQLLEQNRIKSETIQKLEETIKGKKEDIVTNLNTFGNATQNSSKSRIESDVNAIKMYKSELDQVHAREQLIGKLQGVVQRWFSIYAAVRMVNNAIRSIVSTTQELDKTITEIAIVTDMSQADLWKQMPQYTEMARKYAASIPGTYQVSQLYYQQGLGQEDVMALTEETLKMARISGLGYAEATDYMTNAVRSFKMEMQDAANVVDVYSAIAASSATNVTELATAMSKTASSAQAVGSSFENTTAMMAVMIEATRESAENIGSAMKSIISRYGELKENKVGIDSEGEEYSLNKVDTALQSVGISAHDAAGEFRNFDEVIMDLAEKWDTIDTNTQRYIATVMAGNRQQSRFLALVSSYDRLKELSAEAANSEDAAQAQFLKTLDSVEAKTQQLQTSLQSLYVNTGIQDVYKGILDLANGIITSFSNMPRIFNLPIPAILKIGTVFYSVASSVTTIFGLLKYKLTNKVKELSGESTATVTSAEANQTSMLEAEITKRIALLERYYTYKEQRAKGVSAQEAALYAVETQKQQQQQLMQTSQILLGTGGNTKTGSNLKSFFTKDGLKSFFAKGSQGAAIAGIVGNLVGSALTMAASAMGESTQGERTTKGLLTIGGGALRGAGIGASFGLYGILIGGAIGALTSSLEGIGIIIETQAEKLKRLKDEASQSNNTRIEANTKYNNIKSEIDEVRKLAETYQDSAEAKAEYYEHSDALAEQYPQLVASYDAEGHAIIDLTKAYEELAAAAREAKEATEQNNQDNIEVAEEEEQQLKDEAEQSHRNAVYAEYTERDVYFTKEDLEKAQLTDEKSKELLANELEQKDMNWADVFIKFIESYKQESIEALDAGEDETGILNPTLQSIMNGYSILNADFINNLFSNEDAVAELQSAVEKIKDTTLKQLLQYFINSMTGFQEVLTPEEAEYESKKAERIATQKTAVVDETKAKIRELQLEAAYNNGPEVDYLSEFNTIGTIINDSIYSMLEKAVQDAEANNQTINTAEWFKLDEVKQAYTDLFDNLQNFWNSLTSDEQSDFNNLIAKRGSMSRMQFIQALDKIPQLKEDGIHLYDWVYQLLDYYENAFDYEQLLSALSVRGEQKNNNQAFDNIIESSKDTLTSLGDIELHKVLSLYDNLNKKVASETVSQEDADEIFSQYISAFQGQSEEVQSILTNLDIFSFGDVTDAITQLSGEEFDQEKVAPAIAALQALSHKIPINLNTEVSSLIDKFNEGLDDFEKSIKNATKGMNFKTMTEEVEKLGLEFSDFSLKDGKYYINDYIKLSQQLIDGQNNQFQALLSEFDARELQSKKKQSTGIGYAKALGITDKELAELWNDFANDLDKTSTNIIDYYYEKKRKELTASAGQAQQYANDVLARSALESGRLQDFAQLAMGMDKDGKWIWEDQIESDQQAILAAIASGDISKLTDEQKAYYAQYNALIISTYGDIQKNIANSLFESLNGNSTSIQITETNKLELENLQKKGWIKQGNLNIGEYAEIVVAKIQNQEEDFIQYLMNTLKTEDERFAVIKKRLDYKAVDKRTEALNKVVGKQIIDRNDYIDYLKASGYTSKQLDTENELSTIMQQQGLKFNAAGEVIIENGVKWLEDLTNQLTQLSDKASVEERNNIKSQMATASTATMQSRSEASRKIIQNYKSFSNEELEDFATAFGKDFDAIKNQIAISNNDGTYRLNVGAIQDLLKTESLSAETRRILNELIANISDEYLNNISNASSMIIKGTSKQADMQSFVNDFNNKLKTNYKINDIFKWDDLLEQFTLKPEYFQKYVEAQTAALKADGFDDEFIQGYVKSQTKEIQKNIDVSKYLSSENRGSGSQARRILENQLRSVKYISETFEEEDQFKYNANSAQEARDLAASAKKRNEERKQEIDKEIENILTTLDKGGEDAIKAAKELLPEGEELSTSDIEAIYRAQIDPIKAVYDSLEDLQKGSVVAKDQIAILETAGFQVSADGVIEVVGDLAEAYRSLYEQMKDTGEATLSELNAAMGSYLDVQGNRKNQQIGIDALNNAMSMTYSQLAEIYTQLGQELTEDMTRQLMNNGTIKSLGGNKMMIADFDSFASSLGIKSNTIEYTSALKTYNDSLIEFNKRVSDNIANEFNTLSQIDLSKGTQQINLTSMMERYGSTVLELLAKQNDAIFKNGILTVTKDTNLTGLVSSLGKAGIALGEQVINDVQSIIDQTAKKGVLDKSTALSTFASNYQSLSIENVKAFADAFSVDYNNIIKLLKDNANGTYQLDLGTLTSLIEWGKEAVGEVTYNSLLETVSDITDNILGSIANVGKYTYSGVNNFSDMQKFINEFNTLTGSNLGIEDAFSYDTILNTFTLNATTMKRYADVQKAELAKLGLSGKAIDEYIKDQTTTLIQQNMDIEAFLSAEGATAKSREGNKLAQQIYDLSVAKNQELNDAQIQVILQTLENGGSAAVRTLENLKGADNVTTSELEAAFNNSQIVKLRTAMSDLEKGVGETVTGLAMNIMQVTDGFELAQLDDGSAVITAVGDMVEAYANLYAAMKSNADATTGDLNSAYAKLLNAVDQKNIDTLDVLENAAGMTYDAFAEILTRYDKTLEDALSHHFAESDGFGKVRITDFDAFARYMNFDINSPEYAEAYSNYIDSMIELQNQPKEMIQNVANSIKGLADAKPGDQINAAYIAKLLNWDEFGRNINDKILSLGADYRKGILTLHDDANIPALISEIANEAAAAGQMIPEQLAEIADAVEAMLSNIVSLLGNGLSGNLSNADAQTLSSWASQHGVELNFTKTVEGLRISNEQAYQLYQEISKIDTLQGQVAFQQLKENLITTKDEFKTASANISYIKDLENQITALRDKKASPDNEQRIAALEEELALAKQINLERSTSADDSFNFMSNDIPAAQNNPLNYYKNWSEAIKTLNTAMKTSSRDHKGKTHKGLIDYTDFYNIVTEMNNLAKIGGDIKLGAYTLNGDLESASKLIEAGAKALTTTNTGDIAVSLGDIGIDFKTGSGNMSAGIQDGLKAMADSQVDMLDGLIQLLETIVAMEALGDIDTDNNGIDLSDIFTIKTGDNGEQSIQEFTETYKKWQDEIKKKLNKNNKEFYDEDLANAMSSIKIGKNSLAEMVQWDYTKFDMSTAKTFSSTMAALYKAAISDNYDLDNIAESVQQELANAGVFDQPITIDIGKQTLIFTSKGHASINWADEDIKKIPEQLNKSKEDLALLYKKYLEGTEFLTSEDIITVLALKSKLKITKTNNDKITEIEIDDGNGGTKKLAAGTDEFSRTLGRMALDDAGIDSTKEKVKGGVITRTVTYQLKNGIKIVTVTGDSNGIHWHSDLTGEDYPSEEAMQDAEYDSYRKEIQETLSGDHTDNDLTLTKEQWLYQNYHITVKTKVEWANGVDPSKDPDLRDEVMKLTSDGLTGISDWLQKNPPTDNQDGTFTVPIKGEDFTFTSEGGADLSADLYNSLMSSLGLDGTLVSSITKGITDAFSGETGQAISKAIGDGIKSALKTGESKEGTEEVDIGELTLKPSSTKLDLGDLTSTVAKAATEIAEAFADSLSIMPEKIEQATASVRSHFETLSQNVEDAVTQIKANIRDIQEHVPITWTINTVFPNNAILQHLLSGNYAGKGSGIEFTGDSSKLEEAAGQAEEVINGVGDTASNLPPAINIIITAEDQASSVIDEIASAINNLQDKTVNITVRETVNKDGGDNNGSSNSGLGSGAQESPNATGNFGLAKATGTLMGELGPELVVQSGRYFVAGQNGAEFVNLQDDAIVFNHLQTEQLLKKGMSSTRGRAVTNERNAVAFAQGNVNGGPAMASASAALAALKQLRSMWASLASASVQDLAGAGGGGGGGGGKDMAAYLKDLEKWYNWLQKIAELEDKINYQEQLRSTISSSQRKNGSAYYASLKDSLKNLQEQVKTEQSLVESQQKYFDKRRKELNTNGPFNSLYTFDENGQLKYKNGALSKLSKLNETDKYGKPKMSAEEQYSYIVNTLGIDEQYLQTTASGEKIDTSEEGWQATAVQAFWDKMDADKEEMQSLHDSINEHREAMLAAQEAQNQLLQEIRDNQMKVEQSVYDAIVDQRERAIEDMQDTRDAIEDSATKFIDGLQNALDKEREMYETEQSERDLESQRRRLAILQRTGGSGSEIASLQQDIQSAERDLYFDKQQQQIDAIQEASDRQLEKLDQQIELEQELLDYQKEHGILWSQVATIMQGDSAAIASFIAQNSENWSQSPLATQQALEQTLFEATQWTEFRDDQSTYFQEIVDAIYNSTTAAAPNSDSSNSDNTDNDNNNVTYKQIKNNDKQHWKITKKKNGKKKKVKEDHEWNSKGTKCKLCGYKKKAEDSENSNGNTANSNSSSNNGNSNNNSNTKKWKYNFSYNGKSYENSGYKTKAEAQTAGNTQLNTVNSNYIAELKKKFGLSDESAKALALAARNAASVSVTSYLHGGLADFTGLAKLDGTKNKPEAVLSARQTKILRENILSNKPTSLVSLLADFQEGIRHTTNSYSTIDRAANSSIGSISLNMDVKQIANDYDARRAGKNAMEEMLRVARKSTTASIRR